MIKKGRIQEQMIRKELLDSQRSLYYSSNMKDVLDIVKNECTELKVAFTLDWIPEQDRETFLILVNKENILCVTRRYSECEKSYLSDKMSIREYEYKLKGHNRKKLKMALDISGAE